MLVERVDLGLDLSPPTAAGNHRQHRRGHVGGVAGAGGQDRVRLIGARRPQWGFLIKIKASGTEQWAYFQATCAAKHA